MELIKLEETPGNTHYEAAATASQMLEKIRMLILEGRKIKNPIFSRAFFKHWLNEVNYFDFIVKPDYIFVRSGVNSPPFYIYLKAVGNKTIIQFRLSYFRYMRFALVATMLVFAYMMFDSWSNAKSLELGVLAGFYLTICIVIGFSDWALDRYNKNRFRRYINLVVKDFMKIEF